MLKYPLLPGIFCHFNSGQDRLEGYRNFGLCIITLCSYKLWMVVFRILFHFSAAWECKYCFVVDDKDWLFSPICTYCNLFWYHNRLKGSIPLPSLGSLRTSGVFKTAQSCSVGIVSACHPANLPQFHRHGFAKSTDMDVLNPMLICFPIKRVQPGFLALSRYVDY